MNFWTTGRLLAIVAAIITVGSVAFSAGQDREHRTYTGLLKEQRAIAARLALDAGADRLSQGGDVFESMKRSQESFARNLESIRSGMEGISPGMESLVTGLADVWNNFDAKITIILEQKDVMSSMREHVRKVHAQAAVVAAQADKIAVLMTNTGASQEHVYLATRQLMLSERMVTSANQVLEGGEGSVTASDRLGRDALLFSRIVESLLNGNEQLGITTPVKNEEAREQLEEMRARFATVEGEVDVIIKSTPERLEVYEASFEAVGLSHDLFARIDGLEATFLNHVTERKRIAGMGAVIGSLATVLFILLASLGSPATSREPYAAEGA